MTGRDPAAFLERFRIPLIAAPMTGVSGLDLTLAAARSGIGAAFPVHNARDTTDLHRWLDALGGLPGPALPNLVVHRTNDRLADDVATVVDHGVAAVITSVGSPAEVVGPFHDAGILVLSDVASMRHVEHATTLGVDGLVLLAAGAGGQTGWANPLAFVRAVRSQWGGILVLAGGVVDGASMLAALVAGYDLVYMGTPFIATTESAAAPEYKQAVVAASMDDIEVTDLVTGLPSSMIRPHGPAFVAGREGPYDSRVVNAPTSIAAKPRFSAGHSVAAVSKVSDVASLVDRLEQELVDAEVSCQQRTPWPTRP